MPPQNVIERDARMLIQAFGFQTAVDRASDRLVGFAERDDGDRAGYWREVRTAIMELHAEGA